MTKILGFVRISHNCFPHARIFDYFLRDIRNLVKKKKSQRAHAIHHSNIGSLHFFNCAIYTVGVQNTDRSENILRNSIRTRIQPDVL